MSQTTPIVTVLDVPRRCSRYLHPPSDVAAFTIKNLLDAHECRELTHRAEAASTSSSSTGFRYVTEAAHTDDEGITHMVKLQRANRHKLSVFEHSPTLDRVWKRLQPILLPHIANFVNNTNCGPPLGLNPRLRVLRYDAIDEDVFQPHFDATTKVRNLTSLLTVLIYLNDGDGKDFDGGETYFLDCQTTTATHSRKLGKSLASTILTPEAGTAVVFEHHLFHSSVPLTFGTKYVLRTDILFDYDGDIDRPRGKCNNNCNSSSSNEDGPENINHPCCTVLEVCQELSLPKEAQSVLEELGLLDLTIDSFFAPGVSSVRDMLDDVMEEQFASQLLQATLMHR